LPADERTLSPGAARRELGALLKQLREAAHLRLLDAGRPLDRSPATMSRIENGKLAPRLLEVSALLDLYARSRPLSDEIRERALRLAADARKEAWYSPFRDVLTGKMTADHLERYIEFETDAEGIDTYQVEFIPGLLQTARYTQAMADLFYPDRTAYERSRFVEFRLARQDRLAGRADPLRLRAAIRETAVRRMLGSASVMAEQLERLVVDLDDGNPTVDRSRRARRASSHARLISPDAVLRRRPSRPRLHRGWEGADYLQNEAAVSRYAADFAALWNAALSKADSSDLMKELRRSLTDSS
jgi:hypothetical protein